MDKIETLIFQHQNIDTGLDPVSNTNTDVIKEVDIDTGISTYIFPLLNLPHSCIKQVFIEHLPFSVCVF